MYAFSQILLQILTAILVSKHWPISSHICVKYEQNAKFRGICKVCN